MTDITIHPMPRKGPQAALTCLPPHALPELARAYIDWANNQEDH